MNASKMTRLCNAVLQELEDLELFSSYIPDDCRVDQFIHESCVAVHELKGIAKWETINRVTTEQASHIQQIKVKVDKFMRMVPDSARREFEDD
jgi:hypothetical protein